MWEQSPPDFPARRGDQRRRGLGKPLRRRQFETLEPRRLMATVPLDFYAAAPDGEVAEVTLQAPLTLDGRAVELRATLDAQVDGANASLYRGGRGLAPLQPGGPASGDGDVWSTHESLVLSYGLWENGVEVTSQFRAQLREAGAAWSNRNDPTLTLSVQDGGTLTFAGSGAWTAGSVAAEPPIELTDKAAGATLQLAASTPGRFFFRSVSLEVTPLGVSETDWQTTVLPGVGSEWTVFVDAGEYLPIQRDPADRLAQPRILGEWSTSGSWESWQVRGAASATVASGAIDASFAPGASTVEIDLPSIAAPVPLDRGFFDYLQIGLQVPAGYQQDVTLVYGTSVRGANAGRMVLPAAMLAQDGLAHAYRFDLGLEIFYRDNLTSLRIEAPSSGVAGEGLRLDYVEVGDLPGDVLLINSDMNISPEVRAAGDLQRIESKHFATWWSPSVTPSFNPAFHGRNALRMLEESYQVYLKVLGYIEPFYGPNRPTSVGANLATLDFFQAMPAGQALSEFTLVTDFVDQGQTLQLRATLDGVKLGQDAGVYRGASGVYPISPSSTSSTDQNSWETREELTLNWQILRQGVDVTADYDVALVGATAEWTNRTAASMNLTLGSDLPAPLGTVTFDGAGADWNTATVAAAEPIVITAGAAGMEINLSPSPSDHFRLRDLRLRIVPAGSDPGDFDGPQIPSAVPRLDLPRYKTNHTTWYDGFWMSAWNGFTYFNVGPGGLMDEGWGNPVPHEYGHAVQGAQPGFLVGGHWESHANYLRENWVGYFAPLFPAGQQAHPSQRVLTNSNFRQDHQRFLYQDYRIHFALQDYATQLGLDPNVAAQLWQFGNRDQTVYAKLAQLLPADVSLADAIGSTMRYWPTLDFVNGQQMKDNLWSTANNRALYDYQVGSMLIPLPDAPQWHRVPLERAPEKFAYMFHELVPQGDQVTVEFRGVDVIGEGEDWRWSFVALDGAGTPRYSDVWGPGQRSFALLPGEQRVLLVVVATPSDATLDLTSLYNEKPFDKHPDRLRYPYEVRIEGAEPAGKQLAWNAAAGRFHVNPDGSPGGWVANSASVAATAFVGRDAKVLGTARVEGQARIEDFAVVADNARVRGSAVVSGYAAVINGAIVEDQARVRDRALIRDSARIRGQAVVEDYAIVTEGVTIAGSAIVRGSAEAFYSPSVVSGTAILDYDYSMGWVVSDGVHMNHVPWGGWFEDFYTRTSVKPRGLVASYRVEETSGELLWDEFGAQHAYVRGAATRADDAFTSDAALQLNGVDQYVLLDRSVVDLREASFAAWVRPWGSSVQPLLSSSNAAGDYFEVLARDAEGRPAVAIQVDGVRYEAVAPAALELGPWAHVGVTFGNGLMTLYVNGASVAQTATPLVPSAALGPNDYLQADAAYLGRDHEGRLLQGRLDDARFYNVTLTADEIAAESARRGAALGRFFATARLLDGVDDRAESGVPNGLVRTLSADIRPLSSDNVSYYEPVFDSNDELSSRSGSGFGLDNREILVRLDGLGFWRTGVQATLGAWQNVTVTFDGAEAQLLVDGQLRGTRTYQADPTALAAKNYRLGYGQSGDAATRTYFHGEVRNAVIYDRVVTPNAPIPGDFDGDRFVGELDFAVWGTQFGPAAPASDAGPSTSGFDLLAWQRTYGWDALAESAAAAFAPPLDETVATASADAATADPTLWWSLSGPAAESAASRPRSRPAERRPWADVPPAVAAATVRTTGAAGEDGTSADDAPHRSVQDGGRTGTTPLRRAEYEAALDEAWEIWSREP